MIIAIRVGATLATLAVWLFLAPTVTADTSNTLSISFSDPSTIPTTACVVRGATINLTGDLKDTVDETDIEVREGGTVLAQQAFQDVGQWSVKLDTANWTDSDNVIVVYLSHPDKARQRLARIDVTVADSAPFILKVGDLQPGSVPITVSATGAMKAAGYDIQVDGQPAPITLDASGNGMISTHGLNPGAHSVEVIVHLTSGGSFNPEAASFSLASKVALQPLVNGGVIDLRSSTPGNITQAFSVDATVSVASVDLLVDGNPVVAGQTTPLNQVTFDQSKLTIGKHLLVVRITDKNGAQFLSTPQIVQVEGYVPGDRASDRARFEAAFSDYGKWYGALTTMEAAGSSTIAFGAWGMESDTEAAAEASATHVTRSPASSWWSQFYAYKTAEIQKLEDADTDLAVKLPTLELPASLSDDDRATVHQALAMLADVYSAAAKAEAVNKNAVYWDSQKQLGGSDYISHAREASHQINVVAVSMLNAQQEYKLAHKMLFSLNLFSTGQFTNSKYIGNYQAFSSLGRWYGPSK